MSRFHWPEAIDIGPLTVLTGAERGKYPHGNSVLVEGTRETILVDPSLTVAERGCPVDVDRVILSHVHEDHIPGLTRLPDTPVYCHALDAQGLHSLDGLMEIYGMPADIEADFRAEVVEDFYYAPRPDVQTFTGGDEFDLGNVTIKVLHAPGHTRGHSIFLIPEAKAVYLGDIELTGFGPYYGDAWSSLIDFEKSLELCREIDAENFITFHHKWVITGRADFLDQLDNFEKVINNREEKMLNFLKKPRTLEDCVAHRFVYRSHVELAFADSVERRCAEQHLNRMVRDGRVRSVENKQFISV